MSAIFGILRFDGGIASGLDLERMQNTLAHRGPQGRRFVAEGPVGLGQCVMRVTNEDLFDRQPIVDRQAGLILVADCRIDNRSDLAGLFSISAQQARGMPDSAFILRAYKEWGADCAKYLVGDFTFAVWDQCRQKLTLGRDHMGQRSIHYFCGTSGFFFATEIKALWSLADVPRRLSDVTIGRRLLRSLDGPPGGTLFKDIFGLPGGRTLTVTTTADISLHTYWQPHAATEHVGHNEAYYIETYRRLLGEAVACRLRRNTHPPALCFSGGFDSGAIATLAGPIVEGQRRKLIAVSSVGAEGHSGLARDARGQIEACRDRMPYLDVRYHARGSETIFSNMERCFLAADRPVATGYLHARLFEIAAASGARVVMDGHGGDYTLNVRGGLRPGSLLCAGRLHDFWTAIAVMRGQSATVRHIIRMTVSDALPQVPALVRTARRGFRSVWSARPITRGFAKKLFASGMADPQKLRGVVRLRGHRWCKHVLMRQSHASANALAALAAAYGLEFTRPFHDRRVVEFALAIPEHLYAKDGRERYLARRALADVLPGEFQARVPGNTEFDPDFYRMASAAVAPALEATIKADPRGRIARLIDFRKLQRMASRATVESNESRRTLGTAAETLILARFILWVERKNALQDPSGVP